MFALKDWVKGIYECGQSQPSLYSSGFWESSQEKTCVLLYKSHSHLTGPTNEVLDYVDWCLGLNLIANGKPFSLKLFILFLVSQ